MSVSVLLWDFGDTLVDERWMRQPALGCPTWESSWTDVMAELADDWDLGALTSAHVFEALAARTGMSREAVQAHALECCRQIQFHPLAWRYARERHRTQAIVTVNPDLFVDYVVPLHDLDTVFDEIIVSASEQRIDKVGLCEAALARLGFAGERSEVLLIDNKLDNVKAWQVSGGAGYWYCGDDNFGRDFHALLNDAS